MREAAVQTEWVLAQEGTSPPTGQASGGTQKGAPRLKAVNRQQLVFRAVDVELLIEEDHPARAIWAFTGRMDWSGFLASIQAVAGVAGRAAWDPRLLCSVWIYAYSRGISSAREVARRCGYDPAFQWLTGLAEVNYHTLADFRVGCKQALDELFVQGLGLLSAEGLITLERVMHDGTKIRACAGADSMRREERIRAHLAAARAQVAAMGDPRAEPSARQRAAHQRAQRERTQRLEQALVELEKIRATKVGSAIQAQARMSQTDPQARIMKQGDGGYAPSYNAQLSTDAAHGLIVGVGVCQAASDYGELVGAVERVEQNTGRPPQQLVTDGGFTSRENVVAMAEKGVDLIGSLDDHQAQSAGQMQRRGVQEAFYPQAFTYDAVADVYRCPAGACLRHDGQERRIGVIHHRYRAAVTVCAVCRFKSQCCPQNATKGRTISRAVEAPAVQAFMAKMQTAAAKAIYRLRGPVAEFPNAWIKAKIGLRQFRVRGLLKVGLETLWACLTYNIQQWIRLRWRTQRQAATA
ncbi:MAG: IS1182 family transposase [Kiritimatiellaeota bacterium]|nr:IS1182 family transposase [Kiritimatiellota bacterium]